MIYLKVVIVGTTFGNKTIHGPFEDDEHMNQWVAIHVGNQPYEIVPLATHGVNGYDRGPRGARS